MSKDRAAPFSRKHRRYWIPVTGGMILIGVINVVIGALSYDPPPAKVEKIQLNIPQSTIRRDAGTIDAGSGSAPPSSPSSSSSLPDPTPSSTAPSTAPSTPPRLRLPVDVER